MSESIKARIYQPRISAQIAQKQSINARISGALVTMGGGLDKYYVHDQSVASATWNVHHNLGKVPSVTIVDSSGTEWQTEIRNIDINNLQILFNHAMSGSAYCN